MFLPFPQFPCFILCSHSRFSFRYLSTSPVPYYQSVVFIIGVFKSPLSAAVVTLCILVNQSSALWMTAVTAAETLADFYQTTWHHVPQEWTLDTVVETWNAAYFLNDEFSRLRERSFVTVRVWRWLEREIGAGHSVPWLDYKSDDRGFGVRFAAGGKDFALLRSVQNSSGAHSDCCLIGNEGCVSRVKRSLATHLI